MLALVAAGRSNREIASELVLSEHTIRRHLQNVFAKIGVSSRAATTGYAFRHDPVYACAGYERTIPPHQQLVFTGDGHTCRQPVASIEDAAAHPGEELGRHREERTMTTIDARRNRYGAVVVLVATAVLVGGLVAHPYIGLGRPDEAKVAAAVAAHETRWGIAHLTVIAGSALLILAFLALGRYLRAAGQDRRIEWALPMAVLGSALYMLPPAFEFAPLAVADIGGNIEEAQTALLKWFLPVLMTGAVVFAVGAVGFAVSIYTSRILNGPLTLCVVCSLAVMAISRFIPVIAIQLYVQAAASMLAFLPLAYRMWRHPDVGTGHVATVDTPRGRQPQDR